MKKTMNNFILISACLLSLGIFSANAKEVCQLIGEGTSAPVEVYLSTNNGEVQVETINSKNHVSQQFSLKERASVSTERGQVNFYSNFEAAKSSDELTLSEQINDAALASKNKSKVLVEVRKLIGFDHNTMEMVFVKVPNDVSVYIYRCN